MAADVVLSVVETDLRLLAAEAKKAEGPMTNLMGMLHHSDLPAVKDATERALQKIRSVERCGIAGVQQALEILAPFALACETKYAKLACIAISAFQKLLANDAVSNRGRCEIIKALQAAERLSDESVKLRILQASLTIIQSPSFADEQDAIQQLLSLTFRLYVNNKSNFAVHSTAAATIRQAVALVFDHSLLPGRPPPPPAATPMAGSPAAGSSPGPPGSARAGSSQPANGANSPGPPLASGTGGSGAAAPAAATSSSSAAAALAGTLTGADGGPAPGREVVPVLLLEEMMGWLGARDGKELGWVQLQQQQQRGSNRIDRTFLLEMLEAVLLQRATAIHRLPGLVQCVKTKVGPAIHGLLDSACDRLVDPSDAGDCRLVVRCAAALVRRHIIMAPERAAAVVLRLAETAGSVGRPGAAHRWQRFMALQALRPLLADAPLLHRLYHLSVPADKQLGVPIAAAAAPMKSAAAGGDAASAAAAAGDMGGVLPAVVQSLHDALRWYVRTSIETPEDDVVAALGNLYLQRAMGARDSVQETEAFGTNLAHGSEVVIAHLALECVVAMVAATEALTDVVVLPAEPGMPSPKLITRDTPDVRCAAVAGLVSELWRCALGVCNTLLARAGHEVLVGLLVRCLQGITYSAGALGVTDARDALLQSLCGHTLLPPGEEDIAALAVGASALAAVGGGAATAAACVGPAPAAAAAAASATEDRSAGGSAKRLAASAAAGPLPPPAPGFLTAILVERAASSPSASVRVVLTPRNIAALRALFNLAHRLADGLGGAGWLYVVDAVNALDRILASPHTTTAAYLSETAAGGGGGGVPGGGGADSGDNAGLQSMGSTMVPPGAGGGGGTAAAASGAAAAATADSAGGIGDDLSTTAQRELRILASAADQLFENTHHMSPEAVVSLLSALSEISHRTLSELGLLGGGASAAAPAAPALASAGTFVAAAVLAAPGAAAGTAGGALGPTAAAAAAAAAAVAGSPGPVRLCALNRMVDTLLHNLWRVQDLWGIFLAHVLEVLGSNNVQVRAAAVDALDRTITSALNPDLHVPDKFTAPLPGIEDAFSPSFLAASRKALLLSNPPPYGSADTPIAAHVSSRRTSRDISAGAMTSPFASSPGSLQPSAGSRRVSGSGGGGVYVPPVVMSTVSTSPLPPQAAAVAGRRVSGTYGASAAFGRVSADATPSSAQHSHPPLPPPHTTSSPAPLSADAASPFAASLGAATAAAAAAPATPAAAPSPLVANRGVQQCAQREDVQHMLLVALDSLYREGGRSSDVRHGLLRIALHVLQHHGDGLTRGWVPLLRLLSAVPPPPRNIPGSAASGSAAAVAAAAAGGGAAAVAAAADVRLGFQVVELMATDYLASSLPKEHVAKALDVIAKFAAQDTLLNVSLSAITMLWNVTDHLARSRGTFSKAAGAAHHLQSKATAATAAGKSAEARPAPAPAPAAQPPAPCAAASPASSPSPFASSLYGSSDVGPAGERQMSPAFAAALSFARGVPSLPAASSPERSPWAYLGQQQQQQQKLQKQDQEQQQGKAEQTPAAGPIVAAVATGASGGGTSGGGGGSYPLHDLDEAESIAMLMIAFRSLRALSVDPRPEARNAAVRTLFLAVGSHGGKFPAATWQELFQSLLFELLVTLHGVSATSSVEEAAAVELGKERGGRAVVMLVHHSRNSEQKQWDESLVLALGGAAKVMRGYLGVLRGLEAWAAAWEQLMQILGELLASCRKAVCLASTSLLTTVLQTHGSGPLVSRDMWQQALAALDRGVTAMTAPNTQAPLQARVELLTCITTLSAQLLLLPPRGHARTNGDAAPTTRSTTASTATDTAAAAASSPDPEQLLLVLRWLDRFARCPVGADDTSSIHFTSIGPIQKAVLAALMALPPAAAAAGVWPAVLGLLCNMLRPYSTLALRQCAQQAAALQQQRKAAATAPWAASASSATAFDCVGPAITTPAAPALDSMASNTSIASADSSSRDVSAHGPAAAGAQPCGGSPSALAPPWLAFAGSGEVAEARAMSPLWMARVVELLAAWYRDHVSWQVRVATFPLLVGAMSECMACRHLLPQPQTPATTAAGPLTSSDVHRHQHHHHYHHHSAGHLQPQLHLAGDPSEAAALEELWRAASRGFVTVVQTGLPSLNICSSQQQHQAAAIIVPHSTWPALARAFQMFFLAASLPPLQQPPPEVQHALALATSAAGGSGATAAYFRRMSSSAEPPTPAAVAASAAAQPSQEQVAADLEITTAVLDCLSETVLSSCQYAPLEMRRTLVEVLDAGAASAAAPAAAGVSATAGPADRPYDESGLPSTSRLSHVCLNKLYVLCSRGQDAPAPEPDARDPTAPTQPSARSQLEVAQLALPVFVNRCEAILRDYARAEQRARGPSSAAAIAGGDGISGEPSEASSSAAATTTGGDGRPVATAAGSVALHDKALHVLELLQQLRVSPPVSDALLPARPHLRFWLEVLRAVRHHATMPLAAGAAAAAAAAAAGPPGLHTVPSLGGNGGLASPQAVAVARRSSSGFDLAGPLAGGGTVTTGPGAGSLGSEPSLSSYSTASASAAPLPSGPPARSASSSFFARTYSSTGALLSSALGAATGASAAASGSSGAVALLTSPSKRTSGSGGGGSAATPQPRNSTASATAGGSSAPGSVSSFSLGLGPAGLPLLPPPSQQQLFPKAMWVKEQPHLPALYGVLCECIGSSDPAVRAAVQDMLSALGGGVGLCAPPAAASSQLP